MPDSTEGNRKSALHILFAVSAGIMMSRFGVGSLFFCIPLLLFAPYIKKTTYAVLCFVLTAAAVVIWTLADCRTLIADSSKLGIVLMGIVFQLMGVTGCAVWTGLRKYSNNVLRKLVICSFATGFIGIVFVVWLSAFAEQIQIQSILDVFSQIVPAELFGESSDTVLKLVLSVILLMVVPFGIIFSGFQILISELVLHKSDEKWQCGFAYMKMPDCYAWVFLGLWALALGGKFLSSVPGWVHLIVWNLALGLSLHYFIGGMSILTSLLRRRSATLTAGRVFVPVVVACILPGLNLVVFLGLTVLGVSETWIKMR